MDSHENVPSPGVTGGSANKTSWPRRWHTNPNAHEIPEFRDVEELPDGTWRAVHKASGRVITAPTFAELERVKAPVVRILYTLRRSS